MSKPKMEIVWIQNLKALIEHGLFRTDERWKKIFIKQLDEVAESADEITRLRSELANARHTALEEAAYLIDDMIDEDSYPLRNRHLISRAIRALKAEGESR